MLAWTEQVKCRGLSEELLTARLPYTLCHMPLLFFRILFIRIPITSCDSFEIAIIEMLSFSASKLRRSKLLLYLTPNDVQRG